MYVPFSKLPDSARIWIYQANRPFTDTELPVIEKRTAAFLTQWTAHQQALEAGFELPYNRFVVIGLNQNTVSASGCSIDASVRFIQSLEQDFSVTLLDKMNVTYRNGEYIAHKPLADFRLMAKNRSVSPNTIVFNNLVDNKLDYRTHWEVPAAESWHKRFF